MSRFFARLFSWLRQPDDSLERLQPRESVPSIDLRHTPSSRSVRFSRPRRALYCDSSTQTESNRVSKVNHGVETDPVNFPIEPFDREARQERRIEAPALKIEKTPIKYGFLSDRKKENKFSFGVNFRAQSQVARKSDFSSSQLIFKQKVDTPVLSEASSCTTESEHLPVFVRKADMKEMTDEEDEREDIRRVIHSPICPDNITVSVSSAAEQEESNAEKSPEHEHEYEYEYEYEEDQKDEGEQESGSAQSAEEPKVPVEAEEEEEFEAEQQSQPRQEDGSPEESAVEEGYDEEASDPESLPRFPRVASKHDYIGSELPFDESDQEEDNAQAEYSATENETAMKHEHKSATGTEIQEAEYEEYEEER